MTGNEYLTVLVRLALAILLGGVIGFERAERGREAGIRTHILVCLGSALVMLISEYVKKNLDPTADLTRLGAQVISGIGFLGVGCIITNGDRIKGLTTAAGLWTTACVGLAVGIGYYAVSVTIVVLMMFVMLGLTPLVEKLHLRSMDFSVRIHVKTKDVLGDVMAVFDALGVKASSAKRGETAEGYSIIFDLHMDKSIKSNLLISRLMEIENVIGVEPIKELL